MAGANDTEILLKGYPNPRQKEFFCSRARHTAYGGARGGGKSWAMRNKLILLALRYPGLQILLLRRTLQELKDNHINQMQLILDGIADYNGSEHVFTFPNGSRIRLGYCALEKHVYQYQGQEYDVIGLEEATHFTEAQQQFLTTCNRSPRPDFSPRMYYTMNPGGVGHMWVKRLFIDRQYKRKEKPENYLFIPAKLSDNPALFENDPTYLETLENLPEDLRRAHLEGDWDVLSGQYFPEFRRVVHETTLEDGTTVTVQPHLIPAFPIPEHWTRFRAIDYGLDRAVCLWGAFGDMGQAIIYKEYAESNLIISNFAAQIKARTNEPIQATFAPKDMWQRTQDTGRAKAELFWEAGIELTPAANGRVDGWLNLKEWMKPIPGGDGVIAPRLQITDNCTELISCLPNLQHDEKNVSDVAIEPHDITHAPDALRCMMDGRPKCYNAPTQETLYQNYDEQVEEFLDYGR